MPIFLNFPFLFYFHLLWNNDPSLSPDFLSRYSILFSFDTLVVFAILPPPWFVVTIRYENMPFLIIHIVKARFFDVITAFSMRMKI